MAELCNVDSSREAPLFESNASFPCDAIYALYPRKVGKRAALRSIEKALARLAKENLQAGLTPEARFEWLLERVRTFATSERGNAGQFTPYAATWFNQSRYLDDLREWGPQIFSRGKCSLHPNSGLTNWGTCWACYAGDCRI